MHVKIDLAYRVAYLVNDRGEVELWSSGTTRSTVDATLASWGYARVADGEWETTAILDAVDAVRFPVELSSVGVGSAE